MPGFRFYQTVDVRYGDLDPQGHLNNAKYLTLIEQARIQYLRQLGLWDGGSFLDIGIILAEIRITYLVPVEYGKSVRVGVRTQRIGNKSLEMNHCLEDADSAIEYATSSSVLVAYDYLKRQSVPVPDRWRQIIQRYEGLIESAL